MKKFLKTTSSGALVAVTLAAAGAAQAEPKYTFYHILWSMTDANVQFHIKAGEAYMASHPDVEIKYVGPEAYDPAEHAKFLDTVLNASPGRNCNAHFVGGCDVAGPQGRRRSQAFHSCRSRRIRRVLMTTRNWKGLYLTWTGANEEIIGEVMANRVLKDGTPSRVTYLMSHLGHAGQEQRATVSSVPCRTG